MSAPAWIAFAACSGTDPEIFFAEETWMDLALCAETDPEAFFPEKGCSTRPAKLICSRCPVRRECGEYALENNIRFGIWGGMSENERRQISRSRRQEAA